MAETQEKTVIKLVDVVARRRALDAQYAAEKKALDERFKPKLDVIDKWLNKYLVDNNLKTVSTDAGTVMTYSRRNIKMTDYDALKQWAEFNSKEEFIKHGVDSTEVLAYLDASDKNLLPDGLVMDSTNVLAIKAPK